MFRYTMLYFLLIIMILTINAMEKDEKKCDPKMLGKYLLAFIVQFLDKQGLEFFRGTSKFFFNNFDELRKLSRVAMLPNSDAYLHQKIFDDGHFSYLHRRPGHTRFSENRFEEGFTLTKEFWSNNNVDLPKYGKDDFLLGVRGYGYMEFVEDAIIQDSVSDIFHKLKFGRRDDGICWILYYPNKQTSSTTSEALMDEIYFESDGDKDIKIIFSPAKNEIMFFYKNKKIGTLKKPIRFKMDTEPNDIGFFFTKNLDD